MHEPITELQRELGDLERNIRFLQPDKLRWTHNRKALIDQLAPSGRMIIPVGPENGSQEIYLIDKSEDGKTVTKQSIMGVRYVPLTNKQHQLNNAR